jgi:hypothetical protein
LTMTERLIEFDSADPSTQRPAPAEARDSFEILMWKSVELECNEFRSRFIGVKSVLRGRGMILVWNNLPAFVAFGPLRSFAIAYLPSCDDSLIRSKTLLGKPSISVRIISGKAMMMGTAISHGDSSLAGGSGGVTPLCRCH